MEKKRYYASPTIPSKSARKRKLANRRHHDMDCDSGDPFDHSVACSIIPNVVRDMADDDYKAAGWGLINDRNQKYNLLLELRAGLQADLLRSHATEELEHVQRALSAILVHTESRQLTPQIMELLTDLAAAVTNAQRAMDAEEHNEEAKQQAEGTDVDSVLRQLSARFAQNDRLTSSCPRAGPGAAF